MLSALKELDRVLRGEATSVAALSSGTIPVRLHRLAVAIVVLGLFYGLCMGCFAVLRTSSLAPEDVYTITLGGRGLSFPKQLLATTVKVPLLFLLTLIVTFPSLYVFNALVGSRLTIKPVLTLLIATLGLNLAVLASFGTIVAFFSICTTSYSFMVLLNVIVFALSGVLGLVFLLQTLHRITVSSEALPPTQPERAPTSADPTSATPPPPPSPPPSDDPAEKNETRDDTAEEQGEDEVIELALPVARAVSQPKPGVLDRLEGYVLGRQVKNVFRVWVCIFGLVGAQMGWVLRPFIGDPDMPFSWFRERESNFFVAVSETIGYLFGG